MFWISSSIDIFVDSFWRAFIFSAILAAILNLDNPSLLRNVFICSCTLNLNSRFNFFAKLFLNYNSWLSVHIITNYISFLFTFGFKNFAFVAWRTNISSVFVGEMLTAFFFPFLWFFSGLFPLLLFTLAIVHTFEWFLESAWINSAQNFV